MHELNKLKDIEWINEYLSGNKKAARKLYDAHKQSLFMICLRYATNRSDAQDYLQEAFIKIFDNLHQFDAERGAFESWAKRITLNVCLMDIRKRNLFFVSISEATQIECETPDALSDYSLREMLEMIHGLPTGYKTVFNMYVIDGYNHKEIAAELGISVSTSKTQLMKARSILQKKILDNRQLLNSSHG